MLLFRLARNGLAKDVKIQPVQKIYFKHLLLCTPMSVILVSLAAALCVVIGMTTQRATGRENSVILTYN